MMEEKEKQLVHQHISAKHRWLDLKLNEVWQYRDLVRLFAKRSFTVTYKQTILGPAWLILKPLLISLMHLLVFGGIAKMGTDGLPQLLFYFTGTSLWTFFSACFTSNAETFTANSNLFGKVYFPRLTIPIADLISNALCFGIQMLIVIAMVIYYCLQGIITPNWALWPCILIILLQTGILAMGCGILVSSLTTKYRDLSILVTFGVSLWMYATPVAYPLSQLSEGVLKNIILLNPVTAPMECFRYIVLGEGTITLYGILYSLAFTISIALIGIIIFNRIERNFMDTV